MDIAYNRRLVEEGKQQDQLLAYRTKGEYWGKERTVIVTYNPASSRKQEYTFNDKLEVIRQVTVLPTHLSLFRQPGYEFRQY